MPVAEIWPLYTNTKWNLRDRVLGEVEKKKLLYCFIRQRTPCPQNYVSWPGEGNKEFYSNCSEEGVISSWTFFWLVGGEVTGSRHHQPSNCNWPGVSVLVGSIQLPFPTWWGFSICKTAQRYCCVYHLRGNQDPAPRLHCCFLAAPPLSLSVISNYLNLLFGTQEKGMEGELSLCFLQTRNGGHRNGFVPRSPMGSCSVSSPLHPPLHLTFATVL